MPLVIADAFSRLPVGAVPSSRSTTARSPRASTSASGSTDVSRDAAHRRQARQDRPGEGRGAARRGRARPTEQAASCLALAAIRSTDLVLRRAGARPRRRAPASSTRASTRSPRVMRDRRWSTRPGCSSPTCGSPAAWTTTPAPSTRPSSSGTSRGARSAPAAATTRWPRDGRTTYPGVGISIGVSRLLGLLVGPQGLVGQPVDARPACSWPLAAEEDRAAGMRGRRGAAPARDPRARWPRPRRSSASRSATPSGAASRSSGSPARGSPATRSRTSAAGSRSTRTRRRGHRRRPTCVRASSPHATGECPAATCGLDAGRARPRSGRRG